MTEENSMPSVPRPWSQPVKEHVQEEIVAVRKHKKNKSKFSRIKLVKHLINKLVFSCYKGYKRSNKRVQVSGRESTKHPVSYGCQCTQDHDSDTVFAFLMSKSNMNEGVYDYDTNPVHQNLSRKIGIYYECDVNINPISCRLTRNRIHHPADQCQVYGICNQGHNVDVSNRQMTIKINDIDCRFEPELNKQSTFNQCSTNHQGKLTDIVLHMGDTFDVCAIQKMSSTHLSLKRRNSCPSVLKLESSFIDDDSSTSTFQTQERSIGKSCLSTVPESEKTYTPVKAESMGSLQEDTVEELSRIHSIVSISLSAPDKYSVFLPNKLEGDLTESYGFNIKQKQMYIQQEVPKPCSDDLKETIGIMREKMFESSVDLVTWKHLTARHGVRERMARVNLKRDVLQNFLTFDNFRRCTEGHSVQMMKGSEYCYPRFADEEHRNRTLDGLTDVQLCGFARQELARTGWFYNRRVLVTFCCGMEMPITPAGHPLDVHYGLSPQCAFANSLRNAGQTIIQTQPQATQESAEASGGNEIHFSIPVQCSDDNGAATHSLSVEEYSFYSSSGFLQGTFQETVPGDRWMMDRDYTAPASSHRSETDQGDTDSLVTNRTPLPFEEFRPFVANSSQPSLQRSGADQTRNTQTTVGRLSVRSGNENTLNMSSMLQGLEQHSNRRSPPPVFLADQINMDGMRGDGYRARYPQFAFPTVRIWTYEGWPSDYKQSPSMLADAGFFYAGYGDSVLCYCCGIGVRFWKPTDDPWIEHARWRQSCTFMQVTQGQEFIEAAVEMSRNSINFQPSYQEVRIEANRRQRAAEAEGGSTSAAPAPGQNDDTTMLCKVCFLSEMSVILMPCRHLALCPRCSGRISSCPICRTHIESTFQANF